MEQDERGRGEPRESIPVDQIDTGPFAWTYRIAYSRAEVRAVAEQIEQAGEIVHPLRLRREGGSYQLLDGGLRLTAARQLGHASVPAVVEDVGPLEATYRAAAGAIGRRPDPRPLERGWLLVGVRAEQEKAKQPIEGPTQLAKRFHLTKGTCGEYVSLGEKIPRAMVIEVVEQLCAEGYTVELAAVLELTVPALRHIARGATEEEVRRRFKLAAKAFSDRSATPRARRKEAVRSLEKDPIVQAEVVDRAEAKERLKAERNVVQSKKTAPGPDPVLRFAGFHSIRTKLRSLGPGGPLWVHRATLDGKRVRWVSEDREGTRIVDASPEVLDRLAAIHRTEVRRKQEG